MALFNMKTTGSGDSFLWDKFNQLITILNRWADAVNTFINTTINYSTNTFTPTLYGGTVAGSWTFSRQVGTYTKIGNLCWIHVRFLVTSMSGATGNLTVGNLPFTVSNVTNQNGHVLTALTSGIPWPTSVTSIVANAINNTNYMLIYGMFTNGAFALVQANSVTTGDEVDISGCYQTA